MLSLNPARGGIRMGEGGSCIQKRASVLRVKSCQRWVLDKTGGIDPQAKATVCLSHTAHQPLFFFSCCARLAAPLSLCVNVSVRACVRKREKERELPLL